MYPGWPIATLPAGTNLSALFAGAGTGEGPHRAWYRLDPAHDQAAERVEAARLHLGDDVERPGGDLGRLDPVDRGDRGRHLSGPAHLRLDQHPRPEHGPHRLVGLRSS